MKDMVLDCKAYEFRYICTDCRAHTKDPGNPYANPPNTLMNHTMSFGETKQKLSTPVFPARAWWLPALLFLAGCVPAASRFQAENRSANEAYTYYHNRKAGISAVFPGDFVLGKKSTDDGRTSENAGGYADSLFGMNICKAGRVLFEGYTDIPPYFSCTVYMLPGRLLSERRLAAFRKAETKGAPSYLFAADTAEGSCAAVFIEKSRAFVWVAQTRDRHPAPALQQSLLNEYLGFIFPSVKTGDRMQTHIPQNPFGLAADAFKKGDSLGNYIGALAALKSAEANYPDKQARGMFLQAALTYSSFFAHDDPRWLAEWNGHYASPKDAGLTGKEDALGSEAVRQKIFAAADTARAVMFNESHFEPGHRANLRALLGGFYARGFRYLALEALWEDGPAVAQRGFPLLSSGFYCAEPQMSALIREALRLGFRLIRYEAKEDQEREEGQAQNLYDRTFAVDPSAKVLVLAGFDHILEESKGGGQKRMAEYFRSLSGTNPLTINQTRLSHLNGSKPPPALFSKKSIAEIYGASPSNDIFLSGYLNQEKETLSDTFEITIDGPGLAEQPYMAVYLADEMGFFKNPVPVRLSAIDGKQASLALPAGGRYVLLVKNVYGDILLRADLQGGGKRFFVLD